VACSQSDGRAGTAIRALCARRFFTRRGYPLPQLTSGSGVWLSYKEESRCRPAMATTTHRHEPSYSNEVLRYSASPECLRKIIRQTTDNNKIGEHFKIDLLYYLYPLYSPAELLDLTSAQAAGLTDGVGNDCCSQCVPESEDVQ